VDIVGLGEGLTRTVSLAYRTNTARRAALLFVVNAVRAAADDKGLGPDRPLLAAPGPETVVPPNDSVEITHKALGLE